MDFFLHLLWIAFNISLSLAIGGFVGRIFVGFAHKRARSARLMHTPEKRWAANALLKVAVHCTPTPLHHHQPNNWTCVYVCKSILDDFLVFLLLLLDAFYFKFCCKACTRALALNARLLNNMTGLFLFFLYFFNILVYYIKNINKRIKLVFFTSSLLFKYTPYPWFQL